ncbi:MAG: tRNA lysidine(34) synthetase TilS [Pirellulales bacterium]
MSSPALVARFAECWPPHAWRGERLLVAVSGGADSVALLRLLMANGAAADRTIVAHLDHGLRNTSPDDAKFVGALAKAVGATFETTTADVRDRAQRDGDGLEAAARTMRYEWLTATAARYGARYVVTGHTADDRIETTLQRILRGTGIAGLNGIPRVRELSPGISLIRPLLTLRREELRGYLREIEQPWREDESNADPVFLRNRIRNELLPTLLRDYDATADEALLRLAESAAETQAALEEMVERRYRETVVAHTDGDGAFVRCTNDIPGSDYLLRETLVRLWQERRWPRQAMTREHWLRVAGLFATTSEATTMDFPGGVRATKTAAGIEFRRPS